MRLRRVSAGGHEEEATAAEADGGTRLQQLRPMLLSPRLQLARTLGDPPVAGQQAAVHPLQLEVYPGRDRPKDHERSSGAIGTGPSRVGRPGLGGIRAHQCFGRESLMDEDLEHVFESKTGADVHIICMHA